MRQENSNETERRREANSMARIVGLAREGRHSFTKSACDQIACVEGVGIEGDAHAGPFVRHRYLARRHPKMANLRQVHLIPAELLQTMQAEGYELGPGDLGENVLTANIDLESLPLGAVLKLGAAASVEITGLRTPCVLIDRIRPGLRKRLIDAGAGHPPYRAGVMAVVRSGGLVRLGDRIEITFPNQPWLLLPAL